MGRNAALTEIPGFIRMEAFVLGAKTSNIEVEVRQIKFPSLTSLKYDMAIIYCTEAFGARKFS